MSQSFNLSPFNRFQLISHLERSVLPNRYNHLQFILVKSSKYFFHYLHKRYCT